MLINKSVKIKTFITILLKEHLIINLRKRTSITIKKTYSIIKVSKKTYSCCFISSQFTFGDVPIKITWSDKHIKNKTIVNIIFFLIS
jgi:hypothetical protein